MVVDPAFWSGKRVFVTGHTGFKGGWLAHWLKLLGADVTGYSLEPPTKPALFEVAGIGDGLNHILADLRDKETLQRSIKAAKPDIVFHLAAQSLVRRSYESPGETFDINVMGTLNVFEAARNTEDVRAIVNVTTDKCYENREWLWGYRENEPLGGYDPYSASKACSEILTASYRRSFFTDTLPLASARAGNVIGGGDWGADRLLPDLVRGFSADQSTLIRNPDAIRPWQHVLDAVSGYLSLAEHLAGADGTQFAEAWNFGPDRRSELMVKEIVHKAAALWGEGARFEMAGGSEGPHEATFLKLDSTRARTRLGWSPRWDIGTALQATIEWYRAYSRDTGNPADMMTSQIEQYQEGRFHPVNNA